MMIMNVLRRGVVWGKIGYIAFICLIGWAGQIAAAPRLAVYQQPKWADVNKLHANDNWFTNVWDDRNQNGRWDKTEPFADSADPSWKNPVQGGDGTCWLAAVANMLGIAGYRNGDANAVFQEMLMNMEFTTYDSFPSYPRYGKIWWVPGGWEFDAYKWYLEHRAEPQLKSTLDVYYSGYTKEKVAYPWTAHPFDVAADALAAGHQVEIAIYNDQVWHALNLQGYDLEKKIIYVTDSERDQNPNGLDQYTFRLSGPTGWEIDYTGFGTVVVDMIVIVKTTPAADDSATTAQK
jgi:hypothetical protein